MNNAELLERLSQRLGLPSVSDTQAPQAFLCPDCGEVIKTVTVKAETLGGTLVNVILPFGDNFTPDLPYGLKEIEEQEVPIDCESCGKRIATIEVVNDYSRQNVIRPLEGYYR